MRGRKNPPLDLTPTDSPVITFDSMARTYLEDYLLQRYRTLSTARPRVEHRREFLGGWPVDTITADVVRQYQLFRRKQGAEAATINRETSVLSRMFQLAIRRGVIERMPLFPGRLEESAARWLLRTCGVPEGLRARAGVVSGRPRLRVLLGVAAQ